MPIDLRLLRNGKDAEHVEQWQKLRGFPESKVRQVILSDQECRQAQKTLNAYKSSCRQERRRPEAETLQSYQSQWDILSAKFQQELCAISNAVDETILGEMEEWKASVAAETNQNIARSPYRRLVELGAWEVLGNLQSNSGLFCWTGLGMQWGNVLSAYLDSVIEEQATTPQEVQVLQLPSSLELEGKDIHCMMGCTQHQTGSCPVCTEGDKPLQAPSWLGYLKLQYSDQTLGDKQLPKVLQYTVRRASSDQPSSPDPREKIRESSFMLPAASVSVERQVHHILILTSSTYYDSRKAQREWVERISQFYQSLLPEESDQESLVRRRLVAPSDLVPAEVSRIVVEGYVPGRKSGHWVVLAYLSNFSDYPTRACRIKNSPQQFCHVLQGAICSIPETMCWQASHGTLEDGSWKLPEALGRYFPDDRISQVKTLETTKNGRLQIRTLQDSKEKVPKKKAVPTLAAHPKQKESVVVLGPNTKASEEQIKAEALSTPFGFLPFYHS